MNDTRPGNRKIRTIATLSCALGAEAVSFRPLNSGTFRARSLNRVFRQESLGIVPRVKQTGWETQRLFQPR